MRLNAFTHPIIFRPPSSIPPITKPNHASRPSPPARLVVGSSNRAWHATRQKARKPPPAARCRNHAAPELSFGGASSRSREEEATQPGIGGVRRGFVLHFVGAVEPKFSSTALLGKTLAAELAIRLGRRTQEIAAVAAWCQDIRVHPPTARLRPNHGLPRRSTAARTSGSSSAAGARAPWWT